MSTPRFFKEPLQTFDSKQYYTRTLDQGIQLKEKGMELLIEYYNEKYATNITLLTDKSLSDFAKNVNYHLAIARATPNNHRLAFVCVMINFHAIPIIYLKEQDQEGILIADSQGDTTCFEAKLLQKSTNIPVYVVTERRQADYYSCYTEAIIFARDATGKEKKTQAYRIPSLLALLKERSKQEIDYHSVLLPDELLKTAQIAGFIQRNKERSNRKVHKNKTLTQFIERYEGNYLYQKGKKVTNNIILQFNLNQKR